MLSCFTADELEREEFYRLKKVQDKKKKIRKEKEALAAERKARGKGEYFATSGFASFAFFVSPLRSIFVRLLLKNFAFDFLNLGSLRPHHNRSDGLDPQCRSELSQLVSKFVHAKFRQLQTLIFYNISL
jgi:hypothetical protein